MSKGSAELQLEFLRNNSGPTIQHLLDLHLGDDSKATFGKNYSALLELPAVAYWKRLIPHEVTEQTILGSSDACFENAFGKLLSFGLSLKDISNDDHVQNYLHFLRLEPSGEIYNSLARYVVAGYLHIAGCEDSAVWDIVQQRLDALFQFVSSSSVDADIYVDAETYSVPAAYRSKKLVNPKLYASGELVLPLVHDLFVFSHIYDRVSPETKAKIDTIVAFVANDAFQSLDYGYGIVRSKQGKFHSMGWSAHLPLYNDALSNPYFEKGLIFRTALCAKFENERVQKWLTDTMLKLAGSKTGRIQFDLPSHMLPETKNSYFLNGRHTSLNENKRQKIGRIVESTYYAFVATHTRHLT